MDDSRSSGFWLIGLLVAAAGLYPTLAALDVIPTPDKAFHTPRWLVAILASCFLWLGIGLLLDAASTATGESSALRRACEWMESFFVYAGLACFLGGGLIFLHWRLFFVTKPLRGSISVLGFGIPLPRWISMIIGQALLAFVLLAVYLLIAAAVWQAIKARRKATPTAPGGGNAARPPQAGS